MTTTHDSLTEALTYRRAHADIINAWLTKRSHATAVSSAYYPIPGTEERRVIDEYERLSAAAARYAGGY